MVKQQNILTPPFQLKLEWDGQRILVENGVMCYFAKPRVVYAFYPIYNQLIVNVEALVILKDARCIKQWKFVA